MAYTSGGCHDLRKFQNDKVVRDAFSKIISGKLGYVAVNDKREEEKKCPTCNVHLEGVEKFCPECGAKMDWAKKPEENTQEQQPDNQQQTN